MTANYKTLICGWISSSSVVSCAFFYFAFQGRSTVKHLWLKQHLIKSNPTIDECDSFAINWKTCFPMGKKVGCIEVVWTANENYLIFAKQ